MDDELQTENRCLLFGLAIHRAFGRGARAVCSDRQFDGQVHERGQFNGAVLVAKNGKVVYRAAFGLSDESAGITYKPETPSCLASLSKPFTALAIMMLAEQHRLTYEDRISKYFPELPALGAVTVRQFMNHTSGIPD